MPYFLGIDTSNYTTSVAVFNSCDNTVISTKKLLTVKSGSIGVRQSDAVFLHTKALPELISDTFSKPNGDIKAIGVSVKPRDIEDSYMPCFLAGVNAAQTAATVKKCNLWKFSHQRGHIAAALWSSNSLKLINNPFLSFHISGGTTELLLVKPDEDLVINCDIIAATSDLNAGQVIDRVGVMLGLSFPAGPHLEKLALKSTRKFKPHVFVKDGNCSLSGIENQCKKMLSDSETLEDICLFAIESVYDAIVKMCDYAIEKYGKLPIVFAGGVMSNSILRNRLKLKYDSYFALPEFSSDNAVGISVLTAIKEGEIFVK